MLVVHSRSGLWLELFRPGELPMHRCFTAFALLLATAPCVHAAGHRVECPISAPASLGANLGPLDQVAVLSERKGVPIDDTAPPSLVPDRGFARSTVWHNIWLMGDEPGWVHYIDCQYRGSSKILRLPADGLRQCEQTATPYSRQRGVSPTAVHTLACD
jgi:hypothetical protein